MPKNIVGQSLPTLILPVSTGGNLNIPMDLLGSYTVLFFYPKNQTPGCTKEACSFRDNAEDFQKLGAKVYGVSSDDIESHQRFITKHALNFPLISDKNKELAKALEVSSFLGMFSRDTILLDPEAKVAMVWRKVDASVTASCALEELKKRKSAAR